MQRATILISTARSKNADVGDRRFDPALAKADNWMRRPKQFGPVAPGDQLVRFLPKDTIMEVTSGASSTSGHCDCIFAVGRTVLETRHAHAAKLRLSTIFIGTPIVSNWAGHCRSSIGDTRPGAELQAVEFEGRERSLNTSCQSGFCHGRAAINRG
jgi:hypothetical protein